MATVPLSRAQELSPSAARPAPWLVRRPLTAYFALAFAGTWLIVVPLALAGGEYGLGLLPFVVPGGADFLLVQLSCVGWIAHPRR